MYKKKKISAVLLLGGIGNRFKSDLPKQFHTIEGKPLFLHTLDIFLNLHIFDQIILVCVEEYISYVLSKVEQFAFVTVIPGGKTRQQSSYQGLLACNLDTEIVTIHDAVRPFISTEIILNNLDSAIEFNAVDTCIPSTDTIVITKTLNEISSIPDRKNFFRGQTPQTFSYPLIVEAHKKAIELGLENSTDDCSLVLQQGFPVNIVLGDENNIKITSKLDLFFAEQLLQKQKTMVPVSSGTTNFKGKKFLVVGGSGGIGHQICAQLEKKGALAISLSRSSKIYPVDLKSSKQLEDTFLKIYQDLGPVDGLINSAGLLKIKPLAQLSIEEIEELISINLIGLIHCCKMARIKKGGHIINIASSSYAQGRKNYGIYSSAKAAVVNFTQSLAEEEKDLFINVIIPQRTHTQMRTSQFPNEDPKTLLEPSSVACTVLDVLESSFSGSLIEVRM